MTSWTQWTWVWVKSGRWWRTGKPGVLQPMGSQRRTWLSDWATTRWWALLFQFQACSRVSQSFLCVYLFFFKFFSYLDYLEYWAEFSVPYSRSLLVKLVIHKIFLSLTFHGISWKLWTSLCQTVIWKSYRCLHTTLGGSWLIGSPHWEPKLGPIAKSQNCYTVRDAPRTSSGPTKIQVFGKKSDPLLFPWHCLGQFHANLRWNYKEVRINHKWENIIICFSPTSSQAHRLLITVIWTLGVKEVSDVRVSVTSHWGPAECPWVSALRVGIWILGRLVVNVRDRVWQMTLDGWLKKKW